MLYKLLVRFNGYNLLCKIATALFRLSEVVSKIANAINEKAIEVDCWAVGMAPDWAWDLMEFMMVSNDPEDIEASEMFDQGVEIARKMGGSHVPEGNSSS